MRSKDYYQILGLNKSATEDEIRRAFRRLAQQYHPDKGGDAEKFKEINEAYQVLSDSNKRRQYEQFGTTFEGLGGQGFGGQGFNWQDFSEAMGGRGFGVNFGDLGDIFGDLFGGGRRAAGSGGGRGRDLEIEINLDLREAVFGTEKNIQLVKKAVCDKCRGSGAQAGSKIIKCAACKGSGQIKQTRSTFLGTFQTVTTCSACQGYGKRPEKICSSCSGSGVEERPKDIKIKIPAGIDQGQTIKISREGDVGERGTAAGDLYVAVRVRPDKFFRREGINISTKEEIPFPMAALGGRLSVKTLAGEIDLKIPAGTQSGQVFKLKGRGVADINGYGVGDQLVEVIVKVPDKLSSQEKKILSQLAQEMGVKL